MTEALNAVKSTKATGGIMKSKFWSLGMAAVVLGVALLGCQTVKPVGVENSIQTEQTGLSPNGDTQHSTIDFSLVFGNPSPSPSHCSLVPVDILVERTATGFRILSSRIFFQAYTTDYQDVKPELAAQNMKRLNDLTAKLQKFPDYNIRLVGHAVMIYWDNKSLGDVEQKDVLIPLSKARAEAVMKALVDRGLNSSRFTRDGVGASDQLVPDSNLADRWLNRRVAFFLEK
jgi:outer membrane protein OmpA-like peptidoglycan-associated protein